MKPEFTPGGVSIQTFQEIFDELAAGYRAIYGEDINLAPESPDGQRVGIEAEARYDVQQFALAMYRNLDPDFAQGEALNVLIKWAGLERRPGTRSQVDATVTTDRPLTLPADYTVQDDLGQQWITGSPVSVPAGSSTVTLYSREFGAVEAEPGTVTEPVTIVLGVAGISNEFPALVGQEEETDEQLRIRRRRSVENPATSTVGGLYSVLANLPGVIDLVIYENDGDTTDTERDIPPHSLWVVIEGGDVSEIAEAIAKNKTGGTGLKGDIVATYTEILQRPGGSEMPIDHLMQFDRPVYVDLHIRANVESTDGGAPDLAAITEALVSRPWFVAERAAASALYCVAYDSTDNILLTDLEIAASAAGPWTDGALTPGYGGKFVVAPENVTLTVI